MSLLSQLADIFGVRPKMVEVLTINGLGREVLLQWDPEARWFFWRWADSPVYKPLDFTYARIIQHALEKRSPGGLSDWERSTYNALIAAGVETVDPDYERPDIVGRSV